MPNTTINPENHVVANAAEAAAPSEAGMSLLDSLLTEAVEQEDRKSLADIAAKLKAQKKALVFNGVRVMRVGLNGLYADVAEHTLAAPERMFYTIHTDTAMPVRINGELRRSNKYFYCSYYELIGVLKQSPMAAFADVVAANPTAAAILLPGATIDICDEAVAAGEYINPFGSGKTISDIAENTFVQHIINMTSSPTAEKIIEKQAEKFANF